MEDDLKILKWEYLNNHWSDKVQYLGNHWTDLPKMFNLSFGDLTEIKKNSWNEDDLRWKKTS